MGEGYFVKSLPCKDEEFSESPNPTPLNTEPSNVETDQEGCFLETSVSSLNCNGEHSNSTYLHYIESLMVEEEAARSRKKWNFDFIAERPLQGEWEWKPVRPPLELWSQLPKFDDLKSNDDDAATTQIGHTEPTKQTEQTETAN